jgi:hypothetical protein
MSDEEYSTVLLLIGLDWIGLDWVGLDWVLPIVTAFA